MKAIKYLLIGSMLIVSTSMSAQSAGYQSEVKEMRFASDESFSPIVEAARKQYEYVCKNNAQLTPIYTDAKDGLDQLMKGKVHLYFTSSDLTEDQRAYIKQELDMEPTIYRLGYDGVTFIVNKENKDTCISVRDIKRILSGEATNWNRIVKGSKRGAIKVVFDNTHSATVQYCVDSILGGKPMGKNIIAAKSSQGVIDYVEKNPNAIGIIGSNWVMDHLDTRHLSFKMNIQVMSVSINNVATPYNSYKPFQYNLLEGSYPFVRTIYAILVGRDYKLSLGFVEYCTREYGQKIVMQAGLLPYRANLKIKEVNVK